MRVPDPPVAPITAGGEGIDSIAAGAESLMLTVKRLRVVQAVCASGSPGRAHGVAASLPAPESVM
jgi:hypothetical protein